MPQYTKKTRRQRVTPYVGEVNDQLDAIRYVKGERFNYSHNNELGPTIYGDFCWVKTLVPGGVPWFGVVGLDDVLYDPIDDSRRRFLNQMGFKGVTPVKADHKLSFAIASTGPSGYKRAGRFQVDGVCPCKVDIKHSEHNFASVIDGQVNYLESNAIEGAQIMWKPEVEEHLLPAVRWCIIRFGGSAGAEQGVARFIQFNTKTPFDYADDDVECDVTAYWDGQNPDEKDEGLTIGNTCNQHFGLDAGTCGIARLNEDPENDNENAQYQIVEIWEETSRFISGVSMLYYPAGSASWDIQITDAWDGEAPYGANVGDVISVANPLGYSSDTAGEPCVCRLNYSNKSYNIVAAKREDIFTPKNQARFIIFGCDAFTPEDNSVSASLVKAWEGPDPTVNEVYNTLNMFQATKSQTYGIARWNSKDARYQIIQLQCPDLSQSISGYIQADQAFSYDGTPQTVPLTFSQLVGDLVSIANNEYSIDRDPSGAITMDIGMTIDTFTGITAGDISRLILEHDVGGVGTWNQLGSAIDVAHTQIRIPPTDYILGGTVSRTLYLNLPGGTAISSGDKLRLRLQTLAGTTINDLSDLAVRLAETTYTGA